MANDPHNLGDQLSIAVESIVCPQCDSALADLVRVLSPDELEEKNLGVFAGTAGGGGVGAAIGTIGGPVGIVLGGVVGSAVGGTWTLRQRELRRAILQCNGCGYHGCAIDPDVGS